VFAGNRLERLGRVLELHRVAFFGLKIDGHLADQKIERIDLPEAPAFVKNVSAGLKLVEDLASRRRQFAGVNRLLNFGMHGLAKIGVSWGMAKQFLTKHPNDSRLEGNRDHSRFHEYSISVLRVDSPPRTRGWA
jgi:hypothetical protein